MVRELKAVVMGRQQLRALVLEGWWLLRKNQKQHTAWMKWVTGKMSLVNEHSVDICASLGPVCPQSHPSWLCSVSHRLHFPDSIANWCQVVSDKGKPWYSSEGGRKGKAGVSPPPSLPRAASLEGAASPLWVQHWLGRRPWRQLPPGDLSSWTLPTCPPFSSLQSWGSVTSCHCWSLISSPPPV